MFTKAFVVLSGLVMAGSVFAASKSAVCNACSYEQVETAAIGQGVGQRYVHDLASGALYKFQVNREPAPGGRFLYDAVGLSVEASHVQAFLDLKAYYDANGRKWPLTLSGQRNIAKSSAGDGYVSAWDAVDPGAIQNRVADHLSNDWYSGITAGMSGFFYSAVAATKFIDLNAAPQLTFEVIFTDGSKMTFKYDLAQKKFVYVKGTAQDSEGNPIPDTKADVARTDGTQRYYFEGPGATQNRERAMERFQQFGIPISGGRVWACVNAGGTTTCQVVR